MDYYSELVPSRSTPGVCYKVEIIDLSADSITCGCPWFQKRARAYEHVLCWHMRYVLTRMALRKDAEERGVRTYRSLMRLVELGAARLIEHSRIGSEQIEQCIVAVGSHVFQAENWLHEPAAYEWPEWAVERLRAHVAIPREEVAA